MSSHAGSTAAVRKILRCFCRNRRGSAAVEFALVAPLFFALLFAIIETSLVFFASQVLETGVQDSSRLIYTQSVTATDFKQKLCDRVAALFACADVCVDVKSYDAGATITIADPIDGSGNFNGTCTIQFPANLSQTVIVRAFYQWPLIVTGLGYNIANIGRGTSNSKRLLAATTAVRSQ